MWVYNKLFFHCQNYICDYSLYLFNKDISVFKNLFFYVEITDVSVNVIVYFIIFIQIYNLYLKSIFLWIYNSYLKSNLDLKLNSI